MTDVTDKSEFVETRETEPVDKAGCIIRRISELGGYENVDDSAKVDVFGFDIADVSGSIKVMTLFVYIKLFESIVTVEGEDFLNSREEKECYKLVRESTKFIYDRLEEFSKYNCKTASDELNRHMRNMFKNMRSSLKEEVGSIKKDFL